MKQAVIQTGGKQYLVQEGETLKVERLNSDKKTVTFEPLLLINGDEVQIGAPALGGVKVSAEIVEADVAGEKVTAIRYKAKKRVRKVRGHRQHHTVLKVTKIA